MEKIVPHIWFEKHAREAAHSYVSAIKPSKLLFESDLSETPSGTVTVLGLDLLGLEFQFLNAGPLFERNPSLSYMLELSLRHEVEGLWAKLSEGGQVLMPFQAYPFSQLYGWVQDRFGVSWQIMWHPAAPKPSITPSLLFTGPVCGRAEEAMNFYIKTLGGTALPEQISRYEEGESLDQPGTLKYARFRLGKQELVVMDSAQPHAFVFNEMQSFMLYVKDQATLDRYADALSAVPSAEQCGWVKDKFGVSWQLVPEAMDVMMRNGSPEQKARLVSAFLPMKRFDIAALERAFYGR